MFFRTLRRFSPDAVSLGYIHDDKYVIYMSRLLDWTSYRYAYQFIFCLRTPTFVEGNVRCRECCESFVQQLRHSIKSGRDLWDHTASLSYCQWLWLKVINRTELWNIALFPKSSGIISKVCLIGESSSLIVVGCRFGTTWLMPLDTWALDLFR